MGSTASSNITKGGGVITISSESGVHQGDPFGSTLFVLALHPKIMKVADAHPDVLILAYADKVFMIGRILDLRGAISDYKLHLAEADLHLNPTESEANVPAWESAQQDEIQQCPHITLRDSKQAIHVSDEIENPCCVRASRFWATQWAARNIPRNC